MRGKRARQLRQQAYGNTDPRERSYYHVITRLGKRMGRYVTITDKEGKEKEILVAFTIKADTRREIYQHLKQLWRDKCLNGGNGGLHYEGLGALVR